MTQSYVPDLWNRELLMVFDLDNAWKLIAVPRLLML